MGENKRVRGIIESLEEQIRLHLDKIANELARETPDHGLIRHWNKEIQTWTERADKLRKRLPNRR
ncbi:MULTISPECIES: hypothetical protein [Deinococcus]|uniref:Uncharacterized protein n=1 Tax=Deinococcus geothermalis (strain DSM 11300 / CIP 105573 / AG-3a) TaxID=319795 RepID=Q1J2P5_DEIGD|nr:MULTISPECIES: hypothetical protein [Deinococcus]ABF44239.1 hypothetical protein Dgeo_2808 [Deinococcus geothermalis DSM 11300]TDE85655.1 hypothetical protein E0686_10890 [Deinococcus sp. S9]